MLALYQSFINHFYHAAFGFLQATARKVGWMTGVRLMGGDIRT